MSTVTGRYIFASCAVFYGFILFCSGLFAQEVSNTNCEEDWFISVAKDLTVSWQVDDRDGLVLVIVTTNDTFDRSCSRRQELWAKFKDGRVRPYNICSNAVYNVNCTLTCNKVEKRSELKAITAPDAPEISNFKATNTTILIRWVKPPGPIKSYTARKNCGSTKDPLDSVETEALFENLDPYTEYNVCVSAMNRDHRGNWSQPILITTDQGVPYAPRNFIATTTDSERIWVEWGEPEPNTGPILQYELKWTEAKDESFSLGSTNTTSFEVKPLRPYTEYIIWVAAVNEAGKGPSSNITKTTALAVPEPPKFECRATNISIVVTWKGTYRGPYPTFSIRWKEKDRTSDFKILDLGNSLKEDRYEITGVKPFTTYQVQVRARNDAGIGRWSEMLEVGTLIGVPSVPRNLKVASKSARSIVMRWDVPDSPNGPLAQLEYSVYRRKTGLVIANGTKETRFEAKELDPYTDYDFKVCAVSEAGQSKWTDILTVKTDISTPSEPLNLTAAEVTNTSILVQWQVPKHMNGPYVNYVIRWNKVMDVADEEEGDKNITTATPLFEVEVNATRYEIKEFSNISIPTSVAEDEVNATEYEITELDPYSIYFVEVCATTAAGRGKCTILRRIRTRSGIPGSPSILEDGSAQPTSLTLRWLSPLKTNGPLLEYTIHWGVTDTEGSSIRTNENFYKAVGLRPYTEYFFSVAAETEGGKGPFSTVHKRTSISIPSPPRDLLFFDVSDHSILLRWSTPEHPSSPYVEYTIRLANTFGNTTTHVHLTNDTFYRVTDLSPATNYSAQIKSGNGFRTGRWTEPLYFHTKDKAISTAAVAIIVVGVLIGIFIIGAAVLLFLAKRKGGLKNIMITKSPASPTETLQSDMSIQMELLTDSEKLTVRNFDAHVLKLMSNGFHKLSQEFEKLGRESPGFSSHEAKKSENLTKNRWVKILPFDHSRVKLLPVGDEVEPDFINASYVPGDSYLLEYIAAQGPLTNTINDFWMLVWQKSVFLIVMLTQCVERAKRTCERYWPSPGESRKYGTVEVHVISESITSSYIIRLMLVTQDGQQRHIVQLHYINWPVSGCPKSPDDFLTFIKAVRGQVSCGATGPMLVHCSAGIGRTGSFIVVDRLSQQIARQSEELDVYGTVLEMRRYRPSMVQTEEQYYFIHLCVQRLIQEKRQELENDYGEGIYTN